VGATVAREDSDLEVWERQPGESAPAFQAFVVYRNLRSKRSLKAVHLEVGKNTRLMARWSGRHGWVDRAAKFDLHEDRLQRAAMVEAIEEMAKRHTDASMQGVEVLSLPLRALAARMHNEPEVVMEELAGLPASSLIRLAKMVMPALALAISTERMARGEPTAVIEEVTTSETSTTTISAAVQVPDDPDRIAEVTDILVRAGALDIGPDGRASLSAEADGVHPTPTDP
jgi:hypothetical protein